MGKDILDLFEFQTMLKEGVEQFFPDHVWLRAEISAIKARPGGHCYLELSQSDEKGLVAKATAAIWSSKYRFIAPYFESVTGTALQVGIVILVQVQVSYSQLYGFTLVVNDIDPEFTLGQNELVRRRTIERLREEGLMDMQQGLEPVALPYRLAVISAEDAAGYRDFMKHLHENPYGFRFETDLFPALMQGSGCPDSIIAAMDCVYGSEIDYDVVLIMRGGGARLDLACFDDYELAAHIAQFPIPVFTAVGHDQDYHVCDMVAYMNVKTPTALADVLLSVYEDEDARLSTYASRMRHAFAGKISSMENTLILLQSRISRAARLKIDGLESRLDVLQTRISASDPREILRRGYVLAVNADGMVMKSAEGRSEGDKVSVVFSDGRLDCTVDKVIHKDPVQS